MSNQERRSQFSILMREAQEAKLNNNWALVAQLQNQMTALVESIKQTNEV